TKLPQRAKSLWLQALARPEAEMQRMAAESISQAHAAGFPGMEEAIPGLVAVLTGPSSHPAARHAAAQSLVQLDAKLAAPQLAASAANQGADIRQIVEPALAGWKYDAQRTIWKARLTTAQVRHRDLILAIRCLSAVGDPSAMTALLGIVHDRFRPADVRLEAAAAAGLLQSEGLEA